MPVFADLLRYYLRNGSKVFRGANGSGGERRGLLHRELQIEIQRYRSLSPRLPAPYAGLHMRWHLSGINAFLKETVKSCAKNGYVQTLMGRRRYLPGITNTNVHVKAHVNAPPPPQNSKELTTVWPLSITRLFPHIRPSVRR